MKHDPSWIKFYGIGGGTTEPAEHDIGGGTSNDKLPKAWPNRLPHIPESRAEDGNVL